MPLLRFTRLRRSPAVPLVVPLDIINKLIVKQVQANHLLESNMRLERPKINNYFTAPRCMPPMLD
jgi:hypothetical protein